MFLALLLFVLVSMVPAQELPYLELIHYKVHIDQVSIGSYTNGQYTPGEMLYITNKGLAIVQHFPTNVSAVYKTYYGYSADKMQRGLDIHINLTPFFAPRTYSNTNFSYLCCTNSDKWHYYNNGIQLYTTTRIASPLNNLIPFNWNGIKTNAIPTYYIKYASPTNNGYLTNLNQMFYAITK